MNRRPFLPIALFFGAGIMVGRWLTFPFGAEILAAAALLTVSLAFIRFKKVVTLLLLFTLAAVGAVYTQSRQAMEYDHIKTVARYYRSKPVTVRGTVITPVRTKVSGSRRKYSFTLRVEEVLADWGWQRRRGKVLVNAFRDRHVAYGDRIQLEGTLHRPFNFSGDKNFSYPRYLENLGITHIISVGNQAPVRVLTRAEGNIKNYSLKLRGAMSAIFAKYLSANEAGIMNAIILGERSAVPGHVRELFVRTGTAHVPPIQCRENMREALSAASAPALAEEEEYEPGQLYECFSRPHSGNGPQAYGEGRKGGDHGVRGGPGRA